jgi:hypothetical protein
MLMSNYPLRYLCIFSLIGITQAAGQGPPTLTDAETALIKQKLDGYENGTTDYDAFFKPNLPQACEKLVTYYFAKSNEISLKMKLPISRCFAATDRYEQSAALAKEYVTVYSNDWRGWRVLGGSDFMLKDYVGAITALTNAAALGDEANYTAIALAAVAINRSEVVSNLVPRMMLVKDSTARPESDRLDVAMGLTVYAIDTTRPEVFTQAIRGFTKKQLFSRPDLKRQVLLACEKFKDNTDAAKFCDELRE